MVYMYLYVYKCGLRVQHILIQFVGSLIVAVSMSDLLNQSQSTKIYIGYLPVTMTENVLKEVFQRHCTVPDVIIKKANAQGQFDKFCYGFVTVALNQQQSLELIDKLSEENPGWRIKIKPDNDSKNHMNHMPRQATGYQQGYMQPMPPMQQPQQRYSSQNSSQNDKGQVYGEKTLRIMVRELWLGGIPEQTDHNYMATVMSEFGQVEATEIFPKFAFVKYRRAADASLAFESALKIFNIFGSNSGFRLAFSDPSRRKDIVANHYEMQRTSTYIPILFLGFPPITSAKIDMDHMHNICEKYGPIKNYYLKKSTNNQMRSYFLFTYDNIQNAKRAKQELCRRKDLLGEKRVEITLLLDEDSVIAGRDFSYTLEHFSFDHDRQKRYSHNNNNNNSQKVPVQQQQQHMPYHQPPYMGYPGQMMPGYGMMPPPYGYPPPPSGYGAPNHPYYYPPYQPMPQKDEENSRAQLPNEAGKMFDVIKEMIGKNDESIKAPQKGDDDGENVNDILEKMLGKKSAEKEQGEQEGEDEKNSEYRDREPDWSGFLTWKGNRRTGVDGYYSMTGEFEFNDYSINITSLLTNDHVVIKEKTRMMVLQPSSSISELLFDQYIKVFGRRTGVAVTKNWLIYVIGKTELSNSIRNIKDNEILVVFEKSSVMQSIKDRIEQIDDSLFE